MLGLGKETKSEVEFFVMFAIVNAVLSERVKQLVMVLNRMLEEDAAEWAKRERCRAHHERMCYISTTTTTNGGLAVDTA